MKNTIQIDYDRLEMAIRYYLGDIPTDEEIMAYIANEDNRIITIDSVKLINSIIIRLGYKYVRDKIDSVGYGEIYPNDFVKMLLSDFTSYTIKVIKGKQSYA
jgi:hypothetical protein